MINLIWDLDGTLIDSAKEVQQCLELAIKKSGIDLSKQMKPFIIGPTIDKILKESFPENVLNDVLLNKIILLFREIYDNSDFNQTLPFHGIENIVSDKNFIHHIITNKPDFPTKRILEKLGWTKYITSVRTPYTNLKQGETLKTKTQLFFELINDYKDKESAFIGIGDMKTDCITAKEYNITAIGVLWGTGTRDELQEYCDYLVENVEQLKEYLSNL